MKKTKSDYIALAKKLSGKSNTSFRWASAWLLSHSSPQLCRGLRVQQERMEIHAAINRTRLENERGYAELSDHMLPA